MLDNCSLDVCCTPYMQCLTNCKSNSAQNLIGAVWSMGGERNVCFNYFSNKIEGKMVREVNLVTVND